MDDPKFPQLPFLTREMLRFGNKAKVELQIQAVSVDAGEVKIRGYNRSGFFEYSHSVTGGGTTSSETFAIPDLPIGLSVIDDGSWFVQGECYATVSLLINGEVVQDLCSGFVFYGKGISFPVANSIDTRPGGGQIVTISGTNPAAGAEVSMSVPSGQIYRILAINFSLTTDANAANRRVHVQFQSETTGMTIDCYGDTDQAASVSRTYSCAAFGATPATTDDNDIIIPIPQDIYLPAGGDIKTATTNKQAGDDYGIPRVLVERFFSSG